jgi:hypothetical protein
LVTVADVARVLPRHWDGQRLLRFLAGLALLALAFAAHAGLIAQPGPAVAVPLAPATTSTTVDVPAATTVDVPAPPATRPEPVTVDGVPVPAVEAPAFPASVVPAGVHPGAHGSRGPPLA